MPFFNHAYDFEISGGFFENGPGKTGLDTLHTYCTTDAIYDSYARQSNNSCFPGTRTQYIEDITAWITHPNQGKHHRLFWMYGAAGVGKTTVAQSCALRAQRCGALGATFFFSRDNGVDEPARFFTTIAHQLASQIADYKAILEAKIERDRTLVLKGLETQFQELIIHPFLELEGRSPIQQQAVLVDGIDECRDDAAQSDIIALVAKSITTYGSRVPLLWAFFSRPEIHLHAIFSNDSISPLCLRVELPVSRELDAEIRTYLRGSLRPTRHRKNQVLWPSDEDLNALVSMVAGLFIYAATLARYIMDPTAASPQAQLQDVLLFRSELQLHPAHPAGIGKSVTVELDAFYLVIMSQIPVQYLPFTQQLLLASNSSSVAHTPPVRLLANLLGLKSHQLENCLSKLSSVLTFKRAETQDKPQWPGSTTISFYHESFVEFLCQRTRSREFWIEDDHHWAALAVRGLRLLKAVYEMDRMPREKKLRELRRLLPAFLDEIHSDMEYFGLRDELCTHLYEHTLKWCALSGLGAVVREELDQTDFAMFRKLNITVDRDLLDRLPEDLRPHITSLVPFWEPPRRQSEPRGCPQTSASPNEIWDFVVSVLDWMACPGSNSTGQEEVRVSNCSRLVNFMYESGQSEYIQMQTNKYFSSLVQEMLETVKDLDFDTLNESELLECYSNVWHYFGRCFDILSSTPLSLQRAALLPWEQGFYSHIQGSDQRLSKAFLNTLNGHRDRDMERKWDWMRQSREFIKSLSMMEVVGERGSAPFCLTPSIYGEFKVNFLRTTEEYYTADPLFCSNNALVSDLSSAADCLDAEFDRMTGIFLDCPRSARSELLTGVWTLILKGHLEALYTEFEARLAINDTEKLEAVCRIAKWNPKAMRLLQEIFKDYVKKAAVAGVLGTSESGAVALEDLNACVSALNVQRQHWEIMEEIFGALGEISQISDSIDQALGEIAESCDAANELLAQRKNAKPNQESSTANKSNQPTSRLETSYSPAQMGMFSGAHDFVIAGGNFWDCNISQGFSGIGVLLEASLPDVTTDAEPRQYSPSCFPGTRKQYIDDITQWATTGYDDQRPPIYWMRGPAGVGKSAIAQTCTMQVKDAGHLGAAFFFSVKNRSGHRRFFTTLAYQLSTVLCDYRQILDKAIQTDKSLVDKAISLQFDHLIVKPLRELAKQGKEVRRRAIFIDGLDECASTDAQSEIIKIIATSVQGKTTPFRWAFFSRAEAHIVSVFAQSDVSPHTHSVLLPISRDCDGEIEIYLRDGFENMLRRRHAPLAPSWPTSEAIKRLVDASAGLFVYPAAVLRFIDRCSYSGFRERLKAVLDTILRPDARHQYFPFAELDAFYILIMKQIPKDILPSVLLLLGSMIEFGEFDGESWGVASLCNSLGLSKTELMSAFNTLQAVLIFQGPPEPPRLGQDFNFARSYFDRDQPINGSPLLQNWLYEVHGTLNFYHKSFYDFLIDPARSETFCITTSGVREKLLHHYIQRHLHYARSFVIQGTEPVLAPGLSNSAVSLSYPQGNEFVDSFLKLMAFRRVSERFCHDFTALARYLKDVPQRLLQKLAELDYRLYLVSGISISGHGLFNSASVIGCEVGKARLIARTEYRCVMPENFSSLNLVAFLRMVKELEELEIIRPYPYPLSSTYHFLSKRLKPSGKRSGQYKLGRGEKSVIWYWEFDPLKRYFHEFQTLDFSEAKRIYKREKFRMWEDNWVMPS